MEGSVGFLLERKIYMQGSVPAVNANSLNSDIL